MKLGVIARSFLVCALVLQAPSAGAQAEHAVSNSSLFGPNRARTLVIARTGAHPEELQPRLQAVVDYVVRHVEGAPIDRGLAVVTSTNAELLKLLRQGRVDMIPDTLFPALLFRELGRAEILLREWRQGVPTYSGMIIVRADSPIRDLQGLRDRRIAFEDEGSTSAFRLPMSVLQRAGLRLSRLSDPADVPLPGTVGYVFAGSEARIAHWVAAGVVDAGAYSNLDWVDPQDTPAPIRAGLRILTMTDPVVRSAMTVRGDMDPALKDEIKRVLTTMHETAEGREILENCLNVARYDEFTGEAQEQLDHTIELLLPTLDGTR